MRLQKNVDGRLRGKQTVPARLQVLNLAGGECRGGSTKGGGDEKGP